MRSNSYTRAAFALAGMLALGATPARAGLTSTSYLNVPAVSSSAIIIDFDSAAPKGFTLDGGTVTKGSTPNVSAAPIGGSRYYLTAGVTNGSPATIKSGSTTGWQSVTLLWGSIDQYNTLSVLDTLGNVLRSITGSDVSATANGDQSGPATNRYVTYTVDSANAAIGGLRFASTGDAFEVDNIAFDRPVPVPEPGTLALFAAAVAAFVLLRRRRMGAAV